MCWKDFFYFQNRAKQGIVLLLILIVLTIILNAYLGLRHSTAVTLEQNDSLSIAFEDFKKTLTLKSETNNPSKTEIDKSHNRGEEKIFTQNGLSPRQERSGQVTDPAGSNDFHQVESIETGKKYWKKMKLSPGEMISLNSQDTAEWKKVPGIGSAYASRIVKYRNLLGGFVRKEQLLEVYGVDPEMYSRISSFIEPDSSCQRIPVNRSDFKTMLRHPYLNYKQVSAIMNLRRKKGSILSIQELSFLDEFTQDDIFRLKPYLEF